MHGTTIYGAARHSRPLRFLVAAAVAVLALGVLAPVAGPTASVRAVTPATTDFGDINPDNGPGLTGCPAPCTSQLNGGRVNGLAGVATFPGLTPDTYFAASEVGGLFKSIDGGGHWVHLDTHVPHLTWDVAVEPGALRVYATSFFDGRPLTGIQTSTNGGDTWSRANVPDLAACSELRRNQPSAFGIALRPGTTGEVLVGTNCGLARSMDHGVSWQHFDPVAASSPNSIWDVVALPGGRTYACGDDGLLMSPSGADGTWQFLAKLTYFNGTDLGGFCAMAVSPDEPTVVFVGFGDAGFADIVTARRPEFFEIRIDESGATPVVASTRLPYPDDHDGKVDRKSRVPIVATNARSAGFDPDDSSPGFDLWIGDGSLWRILCHDGQLPRCSTVKAEWKGSFTDHLGRTDQPPDQRLQMAHGDSGDLEFDPKSSIDACPTLYSSDGGIYSNGATASGVCQTPRFEGANVGLHAYYLRTMTGFSPTGGNVEAEEDLYFGTQDNGAFYSADAGAQTPTWSHGAAGDVIDIAADGTRTIATVPGDPGFVVLQAGLRGYTGMTTKNSFVPGQPLWDSEILAPIGDGKYLLALKDPVFSAVRGVNEIDITKLGTEPYGVPYKDAAWPDDAAAPCHVVVGAGPSGPVPYVLAGMCWYGTQDIGEPANRPADQLWTFENGAWVEREPGPATPDGTVSEFAGFGLVAVDPKNPLRLYAAVLFDGDSRMVRSVDGGKSWATDWALTRLMYDGFEQDLGDPGDGVRVMPQASLVAFDPEDPDIIVAGGRASGVFITSDGGQTWALLTDPHTPTSERPHLPNPAFARFDHDKPGVVRIYLGTGRGIWRIGLVNADLSVTKGDAPDPAVLGQDLTYTIGVTSAGPDMAQNATFEDELPAGTVFRSVTASAGWSCEHPGVGDRGTVRCTHQSMAPGSASFTLVVRPGGSVDPGAGIVNVARAYSAAIDNDQTGNRATTQTEVIVPVAINISPGTFPNSLNLRARVPVAVLTTGTGAYGLPKAFDATTIDPLSVRFGPATVVVSGGGAAPVQRKGHLEDAFELDETTKDGDVDMVLLFRVADAGLSTSSTEACLAGTYGAGYRFFGCDSIFVVP